MLQTKIRRAIVEVLRDAGGRIEDRSGLATRVLAERVGYECTLTSLSGVLLRMEQEGLIERDISGKRTRAIKLKGVAAPPEPAALPAAPEPTGQTFVVEDGKVRPAAGGRIVTPRSASAIAAELLEQVVARVNEPGAEELKERLGATIEENTRLRRKLADVEEALRAVSAERDGQRIQMKQMQANIQALLDEGRRAVNDETRRALARLMEERPMAREA